MPVTPITADTVASMHDLIKQDTLTFDDTYKQVAPTEARTEAHQYHPTLIC